MSKSEQNGGGGSVPETSAPAEAPPPCQHERVNLLISRGVVRCVECGKEAPNAEALCGRGVQGGEATAPRTYQSAWQWNEDGTSKLVTAEEWLTEEADVDAALGTSMDVQQDAGPDRGGILLAIAKEIQQIRAERTQWAEAATRQAAAPPPDDYAALRLLARAQGRIDLLRAELLAARAALEERTRALTDMQALAAEELTDGDYEYDSGAAMCDTLREEARLMDDVPASTGASWVHGAAKFVEGIASILDRERRGGSGVETPRAEPQ